MRGNPPFEERKKNLIAQGALFRAQVVRAKHDAQLGLSPQRMARGAIHHVLDAAGAALGGHGVTSIIGEYLPTVLPLVLTGLGELSKRPVVKPILRNAAIAGAVSVAATVFFTWKKRANRRTDKP